MKIIVDGAGTGGLTAGLVCKRPGFEIHHYERQTNLHPAGVGILLWPNAVKTLLAVGLVKPLKQLGCRLGAVVTRTSEGALPCEMPICDLERKLCAAGYAVSRTHGDQIQLGLGQLQQVGVNVPTKAARQALRALALAASSR
jgi:2-polyprenyl-6-methoxyphenol hydroxylase-like FAD-dependent oxidoreductase